MTKKKTTTAKAKAAEEVKTEKTQAVKKSTEDVVGKDADVAVNKSAGATMSSSEGKDTEKEKEALKSKENKSKDVIDFKELPEVESGLRNGNDEYVIISGSPYKLDTANHQAVKLVGEEIDNFNKLVEQVKNSPLSAEISLDKDQEQEDKKANEDYNSLKAVAYNKAKDGSFIKLKSKISIEDLQKRANLPVDASRTSEFAMSNGYVFDLEKSELTDKKSNI